MQAASGTDDHLHATDFIKGSGLIQAAAITKSAKKGKYDAA